MLTMKEQMLGIKKVAKTCKRNFPDCINVQYSMLQYCTVFKWQGSTVQDRTVRCGTAQYSTVLYSTVFKDLCHTHLQHEKAKSYLIKFAVTLCAISTIGSNRSKLKSVLLLLLPLRLLFL